LYLIPGNYGEAAARKRLCHLGHPDPIPAHEVVTLSSHQLLETASNWQAAIWSETSGSRIVTSDGKAITTSAARHNALDSVSLRIVKLICQHRGIPFREVDPTIAELIKATGCAVVGSWSEMTMVQRLLIGQDERIVLTDNQRRNPPCQLVGHPPREYDCVFNQAPDPLLLALQGEYQRYLRGESTLGLPETLSVWIEPQA